MSQIKLNQTTEQVLDHNSKLDFKWNQLSTIELRPFIGKYQKFVCEQSVICIQQSFRKYLLLIKKASIQNQL